MALTYMQVHIYLTLPALALLAAVARPLLSRFDALKLAFLSTLAFVYTTPWDNYIVWRGAWSYQPDRILMRIGYVPVEEYMFFIIQTLLSGLFATMVFKFADLPTRHLAPSSARLAAGAHKVADRQQAKRMDAWIRYVPLCAMAIGTAWGWQLAQPGTRTFYLGCILWWVLPVWMLQWYLAGPFIFRQRHRAAFCVSVSSVLLFAIDSYAISHGAWHISPDATVGIMLNPHLPLEEALFFVMTNIILVSGMLTCDRTLAMMKLMGTLYAPGFVGHAVRATFGCEHELLDPVQLNDIARTTHLIAVGSKSFALAAKLFSWDVRHDVVAMYAFCRITDDIADNHFAPVAVRKERILTVRRIVQQVYAGQPFVHVSALAEFTPVQVAAIRHFLRTARHVVPPEPIFDLLKGYLWDLDQRPVTCVDDVVEYSRYVASSVGVMSTYMLLHAAGYCRQGKVVGGQVDLPTTLQRATDMGIALQLVNIARDIITDAKIGRVYVPPEFFPQRASFSKSAFVARIGAAYASADDAAAANGDAHAVPTRHAQQVQQQLLLSTDDVATLRACALDLVSLASNYAASAEQGIAMLPRQHRRAVRAALHIYMAIGDELRAAKSWYPPRAVVSRSKKTAMLLRVLYGA